ncbi:hypothetical protein BH11GEM1_BH11GEM1_34640 [soil metagenome]
MSHVRLRRGRNLRLSSTMWGCAALLAASVLGSCGLLTDPTNDTPDFVFAGTIPRVGNMTFHRLTVPRDGDLTASIEWTSTQAHQTVCA